MTKMLLRRGAAVGVAGAIALSLGACSASSGAGEDESPYPENAIEYIVPFAPGGSTDPVGREFSRLLAEELDVNFNVKNMPGGDSTIGVSDVVNADADGYKIGLSSTAGVIIQPLINPDLSYHSADDFTLLVKMTEAPNAIVVSGDSPYETLDDLIEDAKDRPGEVRMGNTGRYISTSFVGAALEEQADIELALVPYSGGAGEAVLSVMAGEIESAVVTASAQLGLIESGDLRALAYTGTDAYSKFLPDAVALADEGYNIPFPAEYMTVAPAGLPEDVEQILRDASLKVVEGDEWRTWCEEQGYIATPLPGDELQSWFTEVVDSTEHVIDLIDNREQ